jgi:ASC-1-like (ASCH) protein
MKKWVLRIRQNDMGIFEAIVSGKKQVETRAATERYGKVRVGDCLIFLAMAKK